MQVIEAFMALISDWYDVEKYQLKLLTILGFCERTWVQVICMPIMCYLIIIVLIICLSMLNGGIMIELCQLARNINWLDGLAWIWQLYGCGLHPSML